MPRDNSIKKVLVIGSGPIVIGQAAEFDYAGTQACRSLKEEGVEVVLLNSNLPLLFLYSKSFKLSRLLFPVLFLNTISILTPKSFLYCIK